MSQFDIGIGHYGPPGRTAEEERAAVVAWLRGDAGFRMVPGNMTYCDYYADAIERGDHVKEMNDE